MREKRSANRRSNQRHARKSFSHRDVLRLVGACRLKTPRHIRTLRRKSSSRKAPNCGGWLPCRRMRCFTATYRPRYNPCFPGSGLPANRLGSAMDKPFQGEPQPARPTTDRLDSWKEIALYLNRDVTTVQRWEKREGMPVHRHLHDRMGSVYASRAELDTWAQSRNLRAAQVNGDGAPSSDPASPPRTASSASSIRWKFVLPVAAVGIVIAIGAILWIQRTEHFWRNPIVGARFQKVTDFDGISQAAAVSRDGQIVAFLSDRDGQMDVWVTQAGSGEFHNLTRGSAPELVNPSVRTMGFSPDGSLATFWGRKKGSGNSGDIGIWAVPTLGGQPRPYLDGVAEFDWSRDGTRLVYHTT